MEPMCGRQVLMGFGKLMYSMIFSFQFVLLSLQECTPSQSSAQLGCQVSAKNDMQLCIYLNFASCMLGLAKFLPFIFEINNAIPLQE